MGKLPGVAFPIVIANDFMEMPHPVDHPRIEISILSCFTGATMSEAEAENEKVAVVLRALLGYEKPLPYDDGDGNETEG